jgi:serine/threonine protein kinase
MELATNGTLFEFLDRSEDMIAKTQVNSWIQELAKGICYLHVNGIAHRDLRTGIDILFDE